MLSYDKYNYNDWFFMCQQYNTKKVIWFVYQGNTIIVIKSIYSIRDNCTKKLEMDETEKNI